MIADGGKNVLLLLADRQAFRVSDFRARGRAGAHLLQGLLDITRYFCGNRLLSFGAFDFARTLQPALQALLITEHQVTQLG
ncbi:Uncharacterised protein [Serratia fonticola]|uniref:Uncharacterized protein n=1 Tax=Serratia fonticola TaxID=47917 RepID=A0A4U9WJV9_SERFO|nr:Uncharacterised protein [Serratia fonticola]